MRNSNENYIVKSLNGLAYGFFASLIIGTILKQLGSLVHISQLVTWGQIACYVMGPAIGAGVGYVLDAKGLNLISAVIAGTIGAGTFVLGDTVTVAVGNPITAYLAVIIAVEITKFIQGKTPVDILIVPFVSISLAGLFTTFVGPYVTIAINWFGSLINKSVALQPLLMGPLVAVLMGMALTAPISSAAIGIMLGLEGVAAGAALAGCCAQMVGFCVMSIDDNDIGDIIAVGIGTSMLQFKNIVKNPIIWIPTIIASVPSGIISAAVLQIKCTAVGSGMGTAGLVGLLDCISVMGQSYWPMLLLVDVVLPAVVTYAIYKGLKKLGYIHSGDLRITKL